MGTLSELLKTREGKVISAEVDRRIKVAVRPIEMQLEAAMAEIGNLREEIEALKNKS